MPKIRRDLIQNCPGTLKIKRYTTLGESEWRGTLELCVLRLSSAGMGDLLGRRASRWRRTLELSLLRLGQCRDG